MLPTLDVPHRPHPLPVSFYPATDRTPLPNLVKVARIVHKRERLAELGIRLLRYSSLSLRAQNNIRRVGSKRLDGPESAP